MPRKTITAIANDLANRAYSCEELIRNCFAKITKLNPVLNCFITVATASALKQARAIDKLRLSGNVGPLAGIPVAHKDAFCTQGIKTSCGAKMLDNFIAPYDATVVARCKNAGMILLGKTNMDEFSMGSSNEKSFYGPVKNPWNLNYVPGGSSGGSAAAVAVGLLPCATGTDTAGSARQPAAFCGISGLKPTYGRVSRYGIVALASSLDQAAIFANTAEDIALLLQTIAGTDDNDATSSALSVPSYSMDLNKPLNELTIGLPEEYFGTELEQCVADNIAVAIDELKRLGVKFKSINLPHTRIAIAAYHVIAPAECFSNLARFNGMHYGYRCDQPKDLYDLCLRSRTEGFGPEVKRRILMGAYVLMQKNQAEYYLQAQKIRRLIRNDFVAAFKEVDVILGPTTPTPPFKLAEKATNPVGMYMADIYTTAVNMAGLPAISVPIGFVGDLPIGMQFIGNYFAESQILNAAHQYQQVTDWHQQLPPETIG